MAPKGGNAKKESGKAKKADNEAKKAAAADAERVCRFQVNASSKTHSTGLPGYIGKTRGI